MNDESKDSRKDFSKNRVACLYDALFEIVARRT